MSCIYAISFSKQFSLEFSIIDDSSDDSLMHSSVLSMSKLVMSQPRSRITFGIALGIATTSIPNRVSYFIAFSSRESPSDDIPNMLIPHFESEFLMKFHRDSTFSKTNLLSVPYKHKQNGGARSSIG